MRNSLSFPSHSILIWIYYLTSGSWIIIWLWFHARHRPIALDIRSLFSRHGSLISWHVGKCGERISSTSSARRFVSSATQIMDSIYRETQAITFRSHRNISSVRILFAGAIQRYRRVRWFLFEEKPAIDRLLDYLAYQQSHKPAIDILIQEYLERIDSPTTYHCTLPVQISPLMNNSLFSLLDSLVDFIDQFS